MPEESERLTTTIVPPLGPLDAKLCFIGEAPGEEEDIAGEPFVGSAGQFLNNVFRQVGITRSLVLLTNVFNQRPPRNDIAYFYQNKAFTPRSQFIYTWEGQEHIDHLKWWLDTLNPRPNLLVALGKHAIYALTGKKRVWRWRGSILPCTLSPGYKVYCSLHPSAVMRLISEPEEELQGHKKDEARNALPLFINDLERCVVQSEFPEYKLPKRTFDINLSFQQLCDKLRYIRDSQIDCAVDIETIPGGPEGPILWCIGFGLKPDYAFIVPFLYRQRFAWSLPQEALLLKLISEYFLCPAKKIFQYGNYDMSILGRYYGLRVADGTYEDTMWSFHSAFPQLMKGLHVLASMYTWEPYYKDEGKINYGKRTDDNAEFIYNGKDCCVTREIWSKLNKQAREMGTFNGYQRSLSYMPSLLAMIIKGVKCDLEKKEKLSQDYARLVEFHKNKLAEIEGEEINPNSSQQVIKLLYYKHQFKEQRKRNRARSLTADKNALNTLKRLYPNEPVIEHLREFKKFSKLTSQYTKMKVDTDGRIHTSYGFISTWRLNSSESPFGSGGNLQNIPTRTSEGKAIRELFITDDMEPYSDEEWPEVLAHVKQVTNGKVTPVNGRMLMVARDLSQAEARFVVWDAEDLRTMELFLDGNVDVHWERTKEIFGISHSYDPHQEIEVPLIHDVIPMKDLRTLGKTAKHACVDEKTEVLTPFGWMLIKDAKQNNLPIMQRELKTHKASFVKPITWHEYSVNTKLTRIKAQAIDQFVTANHKTPYMTNGNEKYCLADDLSTNFRLPLSGNYSGLYEYPEALIRLIVATQADGYYSHRQISFHLKKERKISRLIQILIELGIEVKTYWHKDGTVVISFPKMEEVTYWLNNKDFCWKILDWDAKSLDIFLSELPFWDGTRKGRRVEYCSANKNNCEIVSTICHLRNKQGLIRRVKRAWIVSFNTRQYARCPDTKTEQYIGQVYCPTVPSGYFFIRRNNTISVTGNSNYGMGPLRFMLILNLQGFYLPFAQCRKILNATVSNDPYLQAWHQSIQDEVRAKRYLTTPAPFLRKRYFHGRFNDNLYRAAYAFKPQSTVGELLEEAIQNIFNKYSHYLDILLNVHDEIIYQVPPHLLGQSLEDTQRELEIPIQIRGRELIIPAEAKAGLNWGQLTEFKPRLERP